MKKSVSGIEMNVIETKNYMYLLTTIGWGGQINKINMMRIYSGE